MFEIERVFETSSFLTAREKRMTSSPNVRIAYFSMEIATSPACPTYAGGLGVLAGDTLQSAADLGVPMAAVTLLHRKGYFRQRLDQTGRQSEDPQEWEPQQVLEPVEPVVSLELAGKTVKARAWRNWIVGVTGHRVPVYFLDTNLSDNPPWERTLTDFLYGGDQTYRLCQEAVLGIGGVRLLRALGYRDIERFHMNEGHSALLVIALLEERSRSQNLAETSAADLEVVRSQCVFTTHTPVPAAFDQFPLDLATRVLGSNVVSILGRTKCCPPEALNMTFLALRCSRYINGVAMRHGELSQTMFPNYPVHSITNGVHATTWTSVPFRNYSTFISRSGVTTICTCAAPSVSICGKFRKLIEKPRPVCCGRFRPQARNFLKPSPPLALHAARPSTSEPTSSSRI